MRTSCTRKLLGLSPFLLAASLICGAATSACTNPESAVLAGPRREAPKFEKAAAEVRAAMDRILKQTRTELDALLAQDPARADFRSTFAKLDEISGRYDAVWSRIDIILAIGNPTGEFKEALESASDTLGTFWDANVGANEPLFQLLMATEKKLNIATLSAEDKYLIEILRSGFVENGLTLRPEQRAQVAELDEQLEKLSDQWESEQQASADAVTIALSAAEADSLPADVVASLSRNGNGFEAKGFDLMERILVSSSLEDVRKRALLAKTSTHPNGASQVAEMLRLRMKKARLFGKTSWADYAATNMMAGNAEEVRTFLNSISGAIARRYEAEKAMLGELKFADTGSRDITAWDNDYYAQKYINSNMPPEAGSLNEFFEARSTVRATLDFFSEMFSIKIDEIPGVQLPGGEGSAYFVTDRVTGEPFGTLLLDVLTREGKSVGWAWALKTRALDRGRIKGKAVSLVSLDFPRPTASTPSLISPSDVGVLFHELGHAFQELLITSKYSSGFNSWKSDSVEIASMLSENLPRFTEVIARVAKHYKDPSKKLPFDALQKIQAARKEVAVSQDYGWFLGKANVDFYLASLESEADIPTDMHKAANQVYARTTYPLPEGTSLLPWFGHLTWSDYAGKYYGYLWSEAIAKDMLTQVTAGGVLNQQSWEHFRKTFLRSNVSGADSVTGFLGRKWDFTPYMRYMNGE